MEEQVEILKHRIHSNCLPPAFNLLDYSLDKIDKILNRSKRSTMNDNDNQLQTILLAHRLKKIDRFKYDMLELSIGAGEEKLKKHNSHSDEFKQLMAAIEARQKYMIE
ncbi:unnamed protein product [Rotaria sp. Silwood2]|nr:unnamed protein product [Rotaria sp. Silwood2]CAF4320645.1 unnamed protein product [Rotaria sp. Silwood2]